MNRGFTLIELLITFALATILLVLGIPTWNDLKRNVKTTIVVEQILRAIHLARSEAIKRGVTISFCGTADRLTCSDRWSDGQIIFIDRNHSGVISTPKDILYLFDAIPAGGHLKWEGMRSHSYMQFSAFGSMKVQNGRFIYCPESSDQHSSTAIVLSTTGRARVFAGS